MYKRSGETLRTEDIMSSARPRRGMTETSVSAGRQPTSSSRVEPLLRVQGFSRYIKRRGLWERPSFSTDLLKSSLPIVLPLTRCRFVVLAARPCRATLIQSPQLSLPSSSRTTQPDGDCGVVWQGGDAKETALKEPKNVLRQDRSSLSQNKMERKKTTRPLFSSS